jgi:hypothetical protein
VLQGSVNRHLGEFNVAGAIIFVSLLRLGVSKRQERNYGRQKRPNRALSDSRRV